MKQYGYHEVRTMGHDALRQLCINQAWFTSGTNAEYSKLLDMAGSETITTDLIVEMATMIAEYTPRDEETMDEQFKNICFQLFRICNTSIVED